jgi:hypothetical protein
MSHEHRRRRAGQGPPVLDIGGDVGALVLLTPESLKGREIEVSPVDAPHRRTHAEVLERELAGRKLCAAVYAALPEGRYRIWDDDPQRDHRDHEVTVVGGVVSQLDWR